ncbi:uncharacterized protein LOC144449790 [Glandiceps talaboti]
MPNKKTKAPAASVRSPPSTPRLAVPQSIEDRLEEICSQVKHIPTLLSSIADLKESQSTINSSLDFFNGLVEELRGRVSTLELENQEVRQTNVLLSNRVTELEKYIESLNQYSRRENIEIHGIVESTEGRENTEDISIRILRKIDPDIMESDIEVTHRLGQKHNGVGSTLPRPIIVRFISRKKRDYIYWNKKKLANINTTNVGYDHRSKIYINENLTPEARQLFKLTHAKRKSAHYKYLWTRNGQVHDKKSEQSIVQVIRSEQDLANIV